MKKKNRRKVRHAATLFRFLFLWKQYSVYLSLGELEAPPRPAPAIFFPLNHTGIPGKVTVTPQAGVIALIYLAQGAGKAVAAGARLTAVPAAVYIDENIKLIFIVRHHQWLADHHRMLAQGKILSDIFAVNQNISAAGPDIHAGNRRLPSSCTDSEIFNHLHSPLLL